MAGKKILIVDDSATDRYFFVEALSKQGYQCITAQNGDEAIEKSKSEQPDVILMDIVMPGIDGYKATRTISHDEATKHIPVIICTSRNQETDRVWGMRQGAKDFLVKPVKFFGAAGIAPNEVLPDAIEIYAKAPRPKNAGAHVLTGPIFVEGAEPGDMLEVRMLDFQFRVPYGVNNSNKGTGVLPDVHEKPYPKVIRFDLARRVALFAPGIEVPLVPFMGIMAVMPPDPLANTRPPGIYGGDMDFNRLSVGSRLYLPLHQRGAICYTCDSLAVEGDG